MEGTLFRCHCCGVRTEAGVFFHFIPGDMMDAPIWGRPWVATHDHATHDIVYTQKQQKQQLSRNRGPKPDTIHGVNESQNPARSGRGVCRITLYINTGAGVGASKVMHKYHAIIAASNYWASSLSCAIKTARQVCALPKLSRRRDGPGRSCKMREREECFEDSSTPSKKVESHGDAHDNIIKTKDSTQLTKKKRKLP